jgi:hypothetical protein
MSIDDPDKNHFLRITYARQRRDHDLLMTEMHGASKSPAPCFISNLAPEVLVEIFSYIPMEDTVK